MQYGHFDNKSREYVIDRVDLPVSWTNYIGVGDMYGVFNHTAGGYLLQSGVPVGSIAVRCSTTRRADTFCTRPQNTTASRVSARTACRWTAPGTISTSVTTISAALRNSGTMSSAAFRYQRPMRV